MAPDPIVTPRKIVTRAPIHTSSPMITDRAGGLPEKIIGNPTLSKR